MQSIHLDWVYTYIQSQPVIPLTYTVPLRTTGRPNSPMPCGMSLHLLQLKSMEVGILCGGRCIERNNMAINKYTHSKWFIYTTTVTYDL